MEFHLCISRWPEGSIYLSEMELRVLHGAYFWFSLQGHAALSNEYFRPHHYIPGPHLQGYGDKIKVARRNTSLCFYTSQGTCILNAKAALAQLLRYFFLWSGILYYSKYSFSSSCSRTLNSVKKKNQTNKTLQKFCFIVKNCLVIVNFSPWDSKANNLSFNFTHVKCYTSNLGRKILN